MKRLNERYERGAAASRQREAIHGGVMKGESNVENMNGSYIVLLTARKK